MDSLHIRAKVTLEDVEWVKDPYCALADDSKPNEASKLDIFATEGATIGWFEMVHGLESLKEVFIKLSSFEENVPAPVLGLKNPFLPFLSS